MIDFRMRLIAGISVVNSLPLVIRNKQHFSRVKRTKQEEW